MANIVLTEQEKLKYFHLALCNNQGYGGVGAGISEEDYDEARKTAKVYAPKNIEGIEERVCIEDVLMEHLIKQQKFTFFDTYEQEEITLSWAKMQENIDKGLPFDHALDFVNQTDDAVTADVMLQAACFGKVIYG